MGLDIYLNSKQEQEASNAHENAWDDWYETWKGVDDDDPSKKAARDAIPADSSLPDVPSERYPEHLFNRRYLRSSYNNGGFNRAVPDFLGEDRGDLSWIFEPVIGGNDEPYETVLDDLTIARLEQAKERALRVAQEIRDADPLRVETFTGMTGSADHMWHQPPDEDEVLSWFREEKATKEAVRAKAKAEGKPLTHWAFEDGGYSNAKGTILGFKEGVEVLAVVPGRPRFTGLFSGSGAAIIVYRVNRETKNSYVQSAEIIAEFCDEAIELIKRDGSCYMHWSG